MQDVQSQPVKPPADAGLEGLHAPALTNAELRQYGTLVGPNALPQAWLIEIARRFLKIN